MTLTTNERVLDRHVQWTIDRLTKNGPVADAADVEAHVDLSTFGISAVAMATQMRATQAGRGAFEGIEWTDTDGAIVVMASTVDGHRVRVRFTAAPDGRVIPGIVERVADVDVALAVARAADLGTADRAGLARCFAATYEDADQSYLDYQLDLFDWIAIARRDDEVVGFVPAMVRTLVIDGLGDRRVAMPGLSCVDPSARRKGLFSSLATAAQMAALDGLPLPDLSGAKFASPASAHALFAQPLAVPRPGLVPNALHRAAGRAIAAALGTTDFDEDHFVCRGSGRPIGRAVLEVDAPAEHWARFAHVDRRWGDTLLGVVWIGDPPAGW